MMGRKLPRAGFSISTLATLPRLPHRHTPRHRDVAPLDRRRAELLAQSRTSAAAAGCVASPRQSRRFSTSSPAKAGWSGTPLEDVAQAVLLHAEAEPLFQHVGGPARTRSPSGRCARRPRSAPGRRASAPPCRRSARRSPTRSASASTGWHFTPRPSSSLPVSPLGSNRAIFAAGFDGRRPAAARGWRTNPSASRRC